jgi:2-methylisocitrate lyase-like PEP mutase family enzyme
MLLEDQLAPKRCGHMAVSRLFQMAKRWEIKAAAVESEK